MADKETDNNNKVGVAVIATCCHKLILKKDSTHFCRECSVVYYDFVYGLVGVLVCVAMFFKLTGLIYSKLTQEQLLKKTICVHQDFRLVFLCQVVVRRLCHIYLQYNLRTLHTFTCV